MVKRKVVIPNIYICEARGTKLARTLYEKQRFAFKVFFRQYIQKAFKGEKMKFSKAVCPGQNHTLTQKFSINEREFKLVILNGIAVYTDSKPTDDIFETDTVTDLKKNLAKWIRKRL